MSNKSSYVDWKEKLPIGESQTCWMLSGHCCLAYCLNCSSVCCIRACFICCLQHTKSAKELNLKANEISKHWFGNNTTNISVTSAGSMKATWRHCTQDNCRCDEHSDQAQEPTDRQNWDFLQLIMLITPISHKDLKWIVQQLRYLQKSHTFACLN